MFKLLPKYLRIHLVKFLNNQDWINLKSTSKVNIKNNANNFKYIKRGA